MKFGGTSVADSAAFTNVASIIASRRALSPVIVVSAMAGVTDALLKSVDLAKDDPEKALASLHVSFERHRQVTDNILTGYKGSQFLEQLDQAAKSIAELLHHFAKYPSLRKAIQDEILSFGEDLSSRLLATVLTHGEAPAEFVDARTLIVTDDQHGKASPLIAQTFSQCREKLLPLLDCGTIPVIGGFIGATKDGATTTLGRGGSDYTAALIGAALKANEIQIWTDVNGVLTADPRVVPSAQTVARLSYGEAAELAYFGAKVLHPKTIQPAIEDNIPVRICNSQEPQLQGTLVCAQTQASPLTIKAIAHKKGVTTVQITSAGMLGAYGFLRAIFEIFDKQRTVVDVVTTSEVSVSLSLDDASRLSPIIEELEKLGTVSVEHNRSIICVVGEGLRGTPGIAASVFNAITDINVTLISQGASSINLTFAVEEESAEEVVRRLHGAFFESAVTNRMIA
jgi:aspartate kinase